MTSNNPSTLPNSGRGPSARFSARYLRALEARRAVAREEVAAIVGGYHPDRVILFGSLARGDSWDGSDVDLLIVKSTATGRLLDRMDEVDRVILFGSLARGDSWDGSDVDLLIVKSTATGRLLDRMDEVLRHTSGRTHVEPLVYTEAELAQMVAQGNPLILQALKEGEVLYDRQQPDQR